ncbi:MAG: hypothetical protein ACPGUC_10315 [Gammaproteobacteria bacterium]
MSDAMLMPGSIATGVRGEGERELLKLFRGLDTGRQESLLSFARFLLSEPRLEAVGGDASGDRGPAKPDPEPRPEGESVIAAIKRLSRGYPMVRRDTLLNETSALMTQHVMQGRSASDVIDDLESLFQQRYEALIADGGD